MTEAFILTFGKAGHPFPILKKHRTLFPIGHLKMEYIVAFVLFLQLSFSPALAAEVVTPEDSPAAVVVGKDVILKPNPTMTIQAGSWSFNSDNIVFWYPGQAIINKLYNHSVYFNESDASLTLRSVQVNESGDYVLNGALPPYQVKLTLSVEEPISNVTMTVSALDLIEFNNSVTLNCSASGTPLQFHWINATSVVTASERVQFSSNKNLLTIKEVTRFDTGPFLCNVSNSISYGESRSVDFNISYGPSDPMMTVTPDKMAYISGSHVNLSCSADSKPAASYMWLFKGAALNMYGQHLKLTNLQMNDTGEYTCLAHNSVTSRFAKSSRTLRIVDPISVVMVNKVDGPPILAMTFTLSCDVTGPVDSTHWMRNGTYLQSNDRTSFYNRNMTLTFSPVDNSDNGDYRCIAFNAVSNRTSQEYMLKVNYGPQMPVIWGPSIIASGSNLMLRCSAASWPPSNFTWYFNTTMVGKGPNYTLDSTSSDNSGNYTCSAYNDITNITKMVTKEIRVIDPISAVMVMEVGEPPILNWTFTLSCNVTGPVDSVHWMMNGSYLHSDERRSLSEGNMTLTFSPVRHSDDGSYQCSAFNAVSNRTSSGFSLRVNYGPENMAISGPSIVATGTNVTLTCSDSSWPPSEVSWFFNGSRVATGPVYQKESVSPADSGQYNCTAHNNITGYSRSATKMLTVIDVISMVMVNKVDGPPELNMTFKLSCDVTGPVDSTYWMRNGTYLQSNDRTSFSNRNMTLTFSPVEHSDNGDYQCVAMNAVSERNSSEYMLMVYYGPWGTAITGPHVATPGSNVTFSCAATSWPPSVYSWYFNGSMVGEGPQMELTNLTFMDRGEYTCKAHNSVTGKNSSASTNLRVVALLTVVTADPKNEQPILGRSFRLTCSANSETTAIYWMKDGMYLGWNSNVSFSEGNVTMTIESVTHADNGEYQCTAHNDVSKKTSSVYQLKVKFGPYNVMVSGPEMAETGSPATFNCSATSWPPSVYSWYFNDSMVANGSVYTTEPLTVGGSGNYTCMALNWVTRMNSSATAELRVIEMPSVVVKANPVIPMASKAFSLSCDVDGPYNSIQWLMDSRPLVSSSTVTISNDSTVVSFNPLKTDNDGLYQCVVNNILKEHVRAYKLLASYGPSHVNISVTAENPITLTCLAASQPPSTYVWKIDGKPVGNSSEIKLSILVALGSSTITCIATNPRTNATAGATFKLPDPDAATPLQSQAGLTLTVLLALFLSLLGNRFY